MNRVIRSTALAALLAVGIPAAHAAVQNYSFSGTLGAVAFSGDFGFDDAVLSVFDPINIPLLTVGPLVSFSMNYGGTNYGLADVWATPDVSFYNGAFLGLSLSNNALTFIPGSFDKSDAYVTDGFHAADVIYAAVPEPESYSLLLAGIGLVVTLTKRRRSEMNG